ncbi:MAG: bifunctional hydroxymethylpyrimidine kinase/phosphomethylpyrimidine kinase [Acidobacteria bacterium]|nr:bifunctional hydroxymethylpyrimidine kinase/phosphomethylpyrimidine kinase [Acidobacteriota bacterium]
MRTALTIAGSDPSGGAGIQADLKTFAAFGLYGTSAITAVTVQDTFGVQSVTPLSADLVTAQIEAVAADITIHATKIGMLATSAIVEAVAAAIEELELPLVVLDPVLVSTSGEPLIDADGVQALRLELLSRARVVTPNLPEA